MRGIVRGNAVSGNTAAHYGVVGDGSYLLPGSDQESGAGGGNREMTLVR